MYAPHHLDLVPHPVPKVLTFSQGLLNNGNSPTLKVYVVAISAHHNASLVVHMLVFMFF